MEKFSLFKILKDSPHAEYLDQTASQEYWIKSIVTFYKLLPQADSWLICTNYAQFLMAYPKSLVSLWYFTVENSLIVATQPPPQVVVTEVAKDELFLLGISAKFTALFASRAGQFMFSFHPLDLGQALESLKNVIHSIDLQPKFAEAVCQFDLTIPDYQLFSRFTAALLTVSGPQELNIPVLKEVDTIKAIAHEVRTPLTTIRTLIKSLLRRPDVTDTVRHRLEKIDFECQDQIARFDLIFEIAKIDEHTITMEKVDLSMLILTNWNFWHRQAERREIDLILQDLEGLPQVLTNKELLLQLLSGLVDRLTRSLPKQSTIRVKCSLAGNYVKVLFESYSELAQTPLIHKAIGQWLMLQPDTGALSLSLVVTKLFFELMGGKLVIRTYPKSEDYGGEVLSVFLPIERAET